MEERQNLDIAKYDIDLSDKEGNVQLDLKDLVFPADRTLSLKPTPNPSLLRPIEIRSSIEEENNPVAALVDGDPESKWSVKGNTAWVMFLYGREILIDHIKIDFHMKKNEKRLYNFDIYSSIKLGEYVPIVMGLDNDREKSKTYDIKNFRSLDNGKIEMLTVTKLMFYFTKTSSRRKRFSINDISVYGFNLSDVEYKGTN